MSQLASLEEVHYAHCFRERDDCTLQKECRKDLGLLAAYILEALQSKY